MYFTSAKSRFDIKQETIQNRLIVQHIFMTIISPTAG